MDPQLSIWYQGSFLLLVPAVVLVRFIAPGRLPFIPAALLVLGGSWLALYLALHAHYQRLTGVEICPSHFEPWIIPMIPVEPDARLYAAYFGWIYGVIYAIPWILVFAAGRLVWSRMSTPK